MDGYLTDVTNIIGLFLLIATGYLVVSQTLLPQFALPWFGRRRRQRAVASANELLASGDLSVEERSLIERSRNTLLAYDAQPREAWSGSLPAGDALAAIERIRDAQAASRT